MTPPNGRRNGLVGTVLDRLLGYADRPWRAAFILVLLLVCAIGFALWEERAAFLRLLSRPEPTALRSDLVPVVANLLAKTTAEGVAIWSVNLANDIGQLVLARRRNGEVWQVQPTVLAAIHEQTHVGMLSKIIRGEPACVDTHETLGPVGQFLVADGMFWMCLIPEPPSSTELLIGLVMLSWKTDPSRAYTDQAIGVARSMTDQIIMR